MKVIKDLGSKIPADYGYTYQGIMYIKARKAWRTQKKPK